MLDLAGLMASVERLDKLVERISQLVKSSRDRGLKREVSSLYNEVILLKGSVSSGLSEVQRLERELASCKDELKANQKTREPFASVVSSPSAFDDAIKGKL